MDYRHKHLTLLVFSFLVAGIIPFYYDVLNWYTPAIVILVCTLTKGLGSEIGSHRLWSHKSFQTTRLWQKILICLNTFAGEGSIIAFVGIHRAHHAHSDTDRDPHNPHTHPWRTIFYQHSLDSFNPRGIRDLFSDKWLVFQHRNYFELQIAIIILALLISPVVLWYYCVNVLYTLWINYLVNVVCHKWGTQDNKMPDTSTNNLWVNRIFLLGAGLHNNHHARPSEYNNAWGNYKFDMWARIIEFIRVEPRKV